MIYKHLFAVKSIAPLKDCIQDETQEITKNSSKDRTL
jgi:hypothetical protein